MTITFAPKTFSHGTCRFTKDGRALCDRVSLYRDNAVLSDVKDKFQESEMILIVPGLDSSVTAANVNHSEFLPAVTFLLSPTFASVKNSFQI